MARPIASLVVPSKDRKADVLACVESALRLEGPIEVIVVDDGSSDATEQALRERFAHALRDDAHADGTTTGAAPAAPGAPNTLRVLRHDRPLGVCVARNAGTRAARAAIVFSCDSDCTFPSAATIRQTLEEFDDPRVGAVAVPYINVEHSRGVLCRAPDDDPRVWVTRSFNGCAYAIRRSLALALGGYWEPIFFYKEEPDLCIRLWNAGWAVRMGRADPVHHHEAPAGRVKPTRRRMNARSTVMYAWHNVPWPWLPLHLGAVTLRELQLGLRDGSLLPALHGLAQGYGAFLRHGRDRRAVDPAVYRAVRAMHASPRPAGWGGLPFDDVKAMLGAWPRRIDDDAPPGAHPAPGAAPPSHTPAAGRQPAGAVH